MDIVTSATTETGKYLLPKIKKHIGYVYKYVENLSSLEVAAEKLNTKRIDACRFEEDTHRKQKDVSSNAVLWKSEAYQLHQKAQQMISENSITCIHPLSRYSTSKHAWELAQEIQKHLQTAPDFGTSFDRPFPESGAKFNLRGFMDFDSRLTVLNGVLEAIKDEKVSMCSICGMGGVGKTTMAKKLILRVEDDRLFDKVAMVTVSQNANLGAIQNEIIELLGLGVSESTMTARASRLNAWLTNNSTLLILDDVWWQFNDEDFEKIGIPLACKGCKIVVTSRNEDECKNMGSQQIFLINALKDGEAWDLFSQNAGKCVEDFNLQETARKVAAECDGLPIAIVTIAKALKDKPKPLWNDSLRQLQKSNLVGISGMEKVYSRIQLSYNLLNDQEAQSCFLLCCLFPEDRSVEVEDLVLFGKGLQLFKNAESMEETRDRVESKIDKLKKSFLLLDGEVEGCVRMHDILRDFAISISSKDRHPYIVGSEKVMEQWLESSQYENCSAISFMCNKIHKHPVNLRCPNLQLLQLILYRDLVGLPIGIFDGLKELKVLVLQVSPMLQSLSTLTKLRTLIINEMSNGRDENKIANIGDLLGHGDMKNLEILVLRTYRSCNDFPEEIGMLCNLRLLKFNEIEFNYMPSGVLSKLVKLEELELSFNFKSWGCKEQQGQRVNASLGELEFLPITTLKIGVAKGSILAEKLVKRLMRFHVCIETYPQHVFVKSNAVLEINDMDACDVRVSWISDLLSKCKTLTLTNVANLKNIMCLQSDEDSGFPQLKDIEIRECNEMEYLVDKMAEPIPSTFHAPLCFGNLSSIYIICCPKLKHVFLLSVAIELRQLANIHLENCAEVEEFFYKDRVDDENQVASSVQLITPTLETTSTPTILNPKRQLIRPTPNSFIQCLRGKEKHPKMVSTPQIMEANIANVDKKEDDNLKIFPQLATLALYDMHKLRILYDVNYAIEFPSLQFLIIRECNKMEGLSYGSCNAPRLIKLEINCIDYPPRGADLNAIVKEGTRNHGDEDGDEDGDEYEDEDGE